ncbi:MAG: hypothetical protein KC619_30775 [Myxococcales bacterium]|nr:hypothetical protein [Myxococcales bacterium]
MGYPNSDLDPLDPFVAKRGSVELELDLEAVAPRPVAAAGTLAGSATGAHRAVVDEPPAGPPERAVQLAEHGPPPPFLLSAPYAVAVIRRNRALREKLPQLRRVRDTAARELEAAALELGRAIHEAADHPRAGELGSPLRRAHAAKKLTADHDAQLAAARDEAGAKIARIEATIARGEEAVRPQRTRVRELSAEVVVFQGDYEAAAGKVQALSAELAALERSASPDPNRRIELEATRTLRKADADAALLEIQARTPELTELEVKVGETERTAAKGREIIARTRDGLAKAEARIEREAADLRAKYDAALRDLADEAVRLKLDRVMVPVESKRARLRYDTYASHERELEMYELALTLHHPESVKRGIATLVALAVTALGVLGFVILG